VVARALELVGSRQLHELTGIQLLPFNTSFQLAAHRDELEQGTVLFVADLVNHDLCGAIRTELTIASTSQLVSISRPNWEPSLIKQLGLASMSLPEIGASGVSIGPLLGGPFVGDTPHVVAVASHDTASAVVSVPNLEEDGAYISSGSWSLVGIESTTPVVGNAAYVANLSNERGFNGTYRILKNVSGLWLIQACRQAWHGVSYEQLMREADAAALGGALVNPDMPELTSAGARVAEALQALCRRTGQKVPMSRGEIVRCILESLACRYRSVLDEVRAAANREIGRVHIVGGGSKNWLLNQLAADITGLPVYAGPAEASSIGNALVQLHVLGAIDGLRQMREVVTRSEVVREFLPNEQRGAELYARYQAVTSPMVVA
jgi:rhamnulokinase